MNEEYPFLKKKDLKIKSVWKEICSKYPQTSTSVSILLPDKKKYLVLPVRNNKGVVVYRFHLPLLDVSMNEKECQLYQADYDFFKQNEQTLEKDYKGKWVLIVNKKIVTSVDVREDGWLSVIDNFPEECKTGVLSLVGEQFFRPVCANPQLRVQGGAENGRRFSIPHESLKIMAKTKEGTMKVLKTEDTIEKAVEFDSGCGRISTGIKFLPQNANIIDIQPTELMKKERWKEASEVIVPKVLKNLGYEPAKKTDPCKRQFERSSYVSVTVSLVQGKHSEALYVTCL